jgi:imidazolonepropionase-like amidohydrolase
MFEADKLQDIRTLIAFVAEIENRYGFKVKPIVMGGAESWLVAKELALLKIPVVIKPTELVPANFEKLRVREDLAAYLVNAGVEVAITSGATRFAAVRRLRQEMGFALKYGLSWKKGLKAITETPAKILGLKDRGVLKVGYKANMVLWSGDLVEPYSTALKVWIEGKEKSLRDRQRLLAEKYL